MFFSFLAVFPLPESYQNDPKFHFNTLLRSDTQKSSKNVENTTVFWSRCETVFGVWSRCETVFGPPPPPPAKADIATAILTNVIEHLVLLLPPNKHAFTAKAVWADFKTTFFVSCVSQRALFGTYCTTYLKDFMVLCQRVLTSSLLNSAVYPVPQLLEKTYQSTRFSSSCLDCFEIHFVVLEAMLLARAASSRF